MKSLNYLRKNFMKMKMKYIQVKMKNLRMEIIYLNYYKIIQEINKFKIQKT